MRARSFVLASISLVALRSIQACGGDDSDDAAEDAGAIADAARDSAAEASPPAPRPDSGTPSHDAAVDAPTDASGEAASDAESDAASDAESDAESDAADDAGLDAELDADADAEIDAGPPAAERVSPATGCVIGLGVGTSALYWAENTINGCTPVVRTCPTSGCATIPTATYLGTSGSSLPIGVAVAAGSPDSVFFTDNQYQHAGLWKIDFDGGAVTDWGTLQQNAAGVTTDGTSVFWVGNPGVYRSSVASAGSTKIFDGSSSNAAQGVAVDATNVYAYFSGKVLACPKGTECVTGGATVPTTIASAASVQDIGSDGTNVFFTAAPSGHLQVYRCPITGCTDGIPELLADTLVGLASEQFGNGIAVAANDVYWGAPNGSIYVCSSTATAPCVPQTWVPGAAPIALTQDATYLYWTDQRGGIYRVAKR
jgi:hypothetical protein